MMPILVNDCEAFGRLKNAHPTPDVRPGTMGEARKAAIDALEIVRSASDGSYDHRLLNRLERIADILDAHDRYHHPVTGACRCGRRWNAGNSGAEVGPVGHVSRLGDIDHFVGMEIRTGPGGWSLEHLEFLDDTLEVLRRNGRVAGIQRGSVIRMESRGGIHIV